MAQNFNVEKEIKEIDSLIFYHDLEIAQRKTEDLSQKLQSDKRFKEQLLEIKFRQVVILNRYDRFPTESLQLLLQIKDEAEKENLHSLMYRIYLMIALAYEKADNFDLTKKYLDKAYLVYKKRGLENIFSTYCIRVSSYFRHVNDLDSSFHYANKAQEYAKKYPNETDLRDSYILLGSFATQKGNYSEALKYNLLLLDYAKRKESSNIYISYINISRIYSKMGNFQKALIYSDSSHTYYDEQTLMDKIYLPKTRYEIYEASGITDSAFHYFKQYHSDLQLYQKEDQQLKTKELEEQYQSDKKEAVIKNREQQIFFIGGLLAVIVLGSVMLIRKNRKIDKQNKVINRQLVDLSKTLEQKQVLLSELQHRVKNNLQHVISILEIQKESVDFNNIDELIRGNQNRIHSMALLHKKLNVEDNANDVDLKRYIAELSELVKESYDSDKKNVTLSTNCEIENISIEKALPLGLIVTELVSNSMKHAFKKQHIGIIHIEITKTGNDIRLYYADNGDGFDFNKTSEKGLGQEIIKGLIDQLDGRVETQSSNGFELTVYFNG